MTLGDDQRHDPPQMPGQLSSSDMDQRRPRADREPGPVDEIVVRDDGGHVPRLRAWLLVGGAGVVVLVLIGVLLVWGPGSPFGRTDGGDPSTSAAHSTSAPHPPTLPTQFATFTLQPGDAPPTAAPGDDLAVATGSYTQNGQPSILLVAAQPVDDLGKFLMSLGATDVTPIGSGTCATYNEAALCGVVRDGIAWAASPLADQTPAELVRIAELAAQAA